MSIILGITFFLRYMLGADALESTVALQGGPFGAGNNIFALLGILSVGLTYCGILLLILYPYFKSAYLENVIKYFVLAIGIYAAFTINNSSIGIIGANAYLTNIFIDNLRLMLLALEIPLIIGISFFVLIKKGLKINKKTILSTVAFILFMTIVSAPSYTLQAIFGQFPVFQNVTKFTQTHRIMIYLGIIIPIIMFIILKNKDSKTKKFILLYLCLATMITFTRNYKFIDLIRPTNWPLHLCNTAMYLLPICLIFKTDKLFYFTVFINVLGAFIAILIPSYDGSLNVFSARVVSFFINHHIALYMPILIIGLGVYERPKLKQFIYSMCTFGVYFILILIINAWFSNYGSVDYFFLNSDFVVSKLGKWAENTRGIVLDFSIGELQFKFFPLYQFLFFVVYILLGLAVWFIYEQGYTFADSLNDIKNRKEVYKFEQMALMSQLNGRSVNTPMKEKNTNKVQVLNYYKKYSNSSKYAVQDASFELIAGKITGFIGPNGAGKSTIIKSMVGIQPITNGEINIFGFDIKTQPVMAKRQIGFVPDHYALYENLTGREYINYIADIYNVSNEERNARIDKYINLLSLIDAIDDRIKTYSHGMKQKIAIISALVHDPKIWILDEPLTGLDPTSIFEIKQVMKEHAKQGNIVFFSSHIIDVVERLCDDIILINKGKIIEHTSLDEIETKNEKNLEQFFINKIKDLNSK